MGDVVACLLTARMSGSRMSKCSVLQSWSGPAGLVLPRRMLLSPRSGYVNPY
jgi:hypothetical protein